MKTKQFISLAIACLMAIMLGSCAEVELLAIANDMNKKCPVKMANGNEMTSVEFEDNTLTFCYTQDIADEDIAYNFPLREHEWRKNRRYRIRKLYLG